MTPRRALAALLLVSLFAAGGVQLLDPQFDERRPPEVDFSEPPAAVAADSAARLSYVDYAYRIDLADNRSGPWEQLRVVWIQHSDREYRKVGVLGERGVILYGTESAAFVRPGIDEEWRFVAHPDVAYPVRTLSQPFLVQRIDSSSAHVLTDSTSMFVVRVESNPMKLVDPLPGNATFHVNKTERTVERVIVTYDTGPDGIRYARFQRTMTDPAVERPDRIGFSPREFGWDLLRGPLFRPFSSTSP